MEFTFSLQQDGLAVVENPDNIRLIPRENNRPLSREESGAILLPGLNRKLESVTVLDYSGSMTSFFSNADNDQNGISDIVEMMESSAASLLDAHTEDTQGTLIEFHNGITDPSIVTGPTSDSEELTTGLSGIQSDLIQDFAGSTRVWDAVGLGLDTLIAGDPSVEEKYLFFFSDGTDESSTQTPLDLASLAFQNNISIYSVVYNQGEPVTGDMMPLTFSVDATDKLVVPQLDSKGNQIFESGQAKLMVTKDAIQSAPTDPGFEFFGRFAELYILEPGANPLQPVPVFVAKQGVLDNFESASVTVELDDFSGPGDFWMYEVGNDGFPTQYINTLDGYGPEDSILLASTDPVSPTMAFSAAGDYQITFKVSGTLYGPEYVETKYMLQVHVAENVELVGDAFYTAAFSFDGMAWISSLLNGPETADPNGFLLLGPESQRLVEDPSPIATFSGQSLFFMDDTSPVGVNLDLAEVMPGFLADEAVRVELNAVGPGDVFGWVDNIGALVLDTTDGIDPALDVYSALSGDLVPFNFAFSAPGDYTITLKAVAQTIDPDEPTEASPVVIQIKVTQDDNILITSATGGETFNARNTDELISLFQTAVFNLQGQYVARWSSLKRGDATFIPAFDVQYNGQRTRGEGSPVVPATVEGNILEAGTRWVSSEFDDGKTRVTFFMDFVPRNFQGLTFDYATTHSFEVGRIPVSAGGLVPDDWDIIRFEKDGVGTMTLRGPATVGRPETLPFTRVGPLFTLIFDEGIPENELFYEFSLRPENDFNIFNFPDEQSVVQPRTELIYGTDPGWLFENGLFGDIPQLVIYERGDQDADGVPTWLEYRFGTNPQDENSVFTLFPSIFGEEGHLISFTTESFLRYDVLVSNDLVTWDLLKTVRGTGEIVEVLDTGSLDSANRYYRVNVIIPSSINLEIEPLAPYGAAEASWLASHFDNGQFVAVGEDGKVGRLDQTTGAWSITETPTSENLWDITYFEGNWYAVGNRGVVMKSSDAVTWEILDTPNVPFLWGITHNGSQLVSVGYQGGILTSEDGETWIERRARTPEFLKSVIWDGDQFVAVGARGTIMASINGINWATINTSTNQPLYDIAQSGDDYVVVGGQGTLLTGSSINGLTQVFTGVGSDLRSAVWITGRYIISSSDNTYIHAEPGNQWITSSPSDGSSGDIWSISVDPENEIIRGFGLPGIIQDLKFVLER